MKKIIILLMLVVTGLIACKNTEKSNINKENKLKGSSIRFEINRAKIDCFANIYEKYILEEKDRDNFKIQMEDSKSLHNKEERLGDEYKFKYKDEIFWSGWMIYCDINNTDNMILHIDGNKDFVEHIINEITINCSPRFLEDEDMQTTPKQPR